MPGPGKPPAVLFSFPKSAVVGRVLPKSKIYEHSKARSQLKNLFVEQIEQIIWQYKLAPETIHLPAQPDVAEIQLFTVVLKVPECSPKVLDCIDRAIPFPIIFELAFDNRVS